MIGGTRKRQVQPKNPHAFRLRSVNRVTLLCSLLPSFPSSRTPCSNGGVILRLPCARSHKHKHGFLPEPVKSPHPFQDDLEGVTTDQSWRRLGTKRWLPMNAIAQGAVAKPIALALIPEQQAPLGASRVRCVQM